MQPKRSIFAAATLTLMLTGAAFAQTAPSGPAAEVLTSYNRLKGNIIKACREDARGQLRVQDYAGYPDLRAGSEPHHGGAVPYLHDAEWKEVRGVDGAFGHGG